MLCLQRLTRPFASRNSKITGVSVAESILQLAIYDTSQAVTTTPATSPHIAASSFVSAPLPARLDNPLPRASSFYVCNLASTTLASDVEGVFRKHLDPKIGVKATIKLGVDVLTGSAVVELTVPVEAAKLCSALSSTVIKGSPIVVEVKKAPEADKTTRNKSATPALRQSSSAPVTDANTVVKSACFTVENLSVRATSAEIEDAFVGTGVVARSDVKSVSLGAGGGSARILLKRRVAVEPVIESVGKVDLGGRRLVVSAEEETTVTKEVEETMATATATNGAPRTKPQPPVHLLSGRALPRSTSYSTSPAPAPHPPSPEQVAPPSHVGLQSPPAPASGALLHPPPPSPALTKLFAPLDSAPSATFDRTVELSATFGYLPPDIAEKALQLGVPQQRASDEWRAVGYEKFLRSQLWPDDGAEKDHYTMCVRRCHCSTCCAQKLILLALAASLHN